MTDVHGPVFSQINLVVADMTESLAFYGRLGLTPTATPDGAHAETRLPGGLSIEWDAAEFAAVWDSVPAARRPVARCSASTCPAGRRSTTCVAN